MNRCGSRGLVVSDLHLFASRSTGKEVMSTLEHRLSRVDFLVLNGDTFDFKWSTLPSTSASIAAAREWLEDLIERHKEIRIYFVIGNHENFKDFMSILPEFSERFENFSWHSEILRLGSNLFIHGDVCNRNDMTSESLLGYRKRFGVRGRAGIAARFIYAVATLLRVHKVVYLIHRKTVLADRIIGYMHREFDSELQEISTIYFGHTHAAFSGFEYKGFVFCNTGAAIKGLKSKIFEIKC